MTTYRLRIGDGLMCDGPGPGHIMDAGDTVILEIHEDKVVGCYCERCWKQLVKEDNNG